MSSKAKIVFTPSGKRGEFDLGTPVLQAARQLGVDIDSICGGNGMCGRCQILVGEGEFAKHGIASTAANLGEPSRVELRYAEKRNMSADRRLSCQAKIEGDLVIDVPANSQVHRQVVRKAVVDRDIPIDPVVTLYHVAVREPDMHEPSSDLRRLYEALANAGAPKNLDISVHLLTGLQSVLRAGDGVDNASKWRVTAAVHRDGRILALWPAKKNGLYGMAVDVGSTTMSAQLCDLTSGEVVASAGIMNPQIRFGEDVMSRVSYSMMNAGGAGEMTEAVREALNELAVAVCEDAEITTHDILDIVLVGNPIMHHLILGIDPVELGGAPFALTTDMGTNIPARQLGLFLNDGAQAYILPCIAGHVGADTAAVALSEAPDEDEGLTFIVDVGTNAEMLLGNQTRILAASSPTGPAFEGAQISSGQRAAPGAIERVRIDRSTLDPKFQVIGNELWSDNPDFAEATKATGVTGICGSGIIEALAEMFLNGIILHNGTIDGSLAKRTSRIVPDGPTFKYLLHEGDGDQPTVYVTQNDVRAIQMAKAALYAGYQLLNDKLDGASPTKVLLAGAFGSHIDVKYAMVLGMLPDCDLAHVKGVGNAAGTGARMALLNYQNRQKIEDLVRRIEKIETAIEAKFQDHFVDAMALPHAKAPFSHLAAEVTLPTPTASANEPGDGRRRRRRRG